MKFQKFEKIPRLSRDVILTEKIDGTNAQVCIINFDDYLCKTVDLPDEGIDFKSKHCLYEKDGLLMFAGSRRKWLDISSKGDNFGFAKWVQSNAEELMKLGEGKHYGEWYGQGIQRNYGLDEKRFALFNVGKWGDEEVRPKCCEVVPVLYEGEFDTMVIIGVLEELKDNGSQVVKGFMNPEGVIIYHKHSGRLFKKTVVDDEKPKGSNEPETVLDKVK